MHQSYRKATGYGLGGIAKKVRRYCPDDFFFERKILLENQQKLKTTLFTKYIHICTSHHQLHIQTLYIIPNVVFTMVKKAFIKWKAIEESSSTYIRGLSRINANILVILAISCCMYRKSEVLQQPIPSHNDYRGITCLILMLLK